MSELHYGKNVEWFLRELSAHESGDIESAEIEIIGENKQGVEGFTTIDITLLAADAVSMIAALQHKLDAVLAENVALRKAHPQPFGPEMMKAIDAYIAKEDEVPEQGMMDAFFILRDSITLKSAQVDAILNEVRAEAVASLWRESLRDVGRVLSEIGAYHDASEAGGIVHHEIKERVGDRIAKLRAGKVEEGE